MDLVAGDGRAAATVRRAGVLARGFSEGRRVGCKLGAGAGATCWTDLRDVLTTWPPPDVMWADPHGLVASIALQCSPTKEAVAALEGSDFTLRELAALQLCEGAAAVGWVRERWPGLTPGLDRLTEGLTPESWDGVGGEELAARARRLAAERRAVLPVPAVLGQLPLRWATSSAYSWLRRRLGVRLRVVGDRLERFGDQVGEPIAVEGAEEGPGLKHRLPIAGNEAEEPTGLARPGIPYPEWDESAQAYRPDFTRVVEFRGKRGPAASAQRSPELEGWLRLPLERQWRGRLTDGGDVDIDGVIDSIVDAAVGHSASERLYRDRIHVERDVACAVLIDSSGSLAQAELLTHEIACADALVDAMEQAGERYAVFAFWSNGRHQVALDVLRDFGESARPSAALLRPTHHTRLGAAIRAVTARLVAEEARRRVLLILSDGVPFDDGYEDDYACADVAKAVEEAELHEVSVALLCVGDGTRSPLRERLRERVHGVERIQDLAPALGAVHQRLIA